MEKEILLLLMDRYLKGFLKIPWKTEEILYFQKVESVKKNYNVNKQQLMGIGLSFIPTNLKVYGLISINGNGNLTSYEMDYSLN